MLYAGGGTVLPGLHDHHVHLRSAASALDSFFVGPPGVSTQSQLTQLLANATPGPDGWIRAVGYHDSVAGNSTGPRWTRWSATFRCASSIAAVRCGSSTPRRWAGSAWPNTPTGACAARTAAGRRRWTDAKPTSPNSAAASPRPASPASPTPPGLDADDMASLSAAHGSGEFRPRLRFLSPGKKILHDDRLDLDGLTEWIARQHNMGQPVALHCVTAAQLVVAIAALRAAGGHPQDRIEHAAVVPDDNLADLADLGVTVVTQPNFVAERGDQYLVDVPAAEHDQLWRVAALRDAGCRSRCPPTCRSATATHGRRCAPRCTAPRRAVLFWGPTNVFRPQRL